MRSVLLAGMSLLAVGVLPVAAADLSAPPRPAPVYTKAPPAPAYFNWNGFYLGVNAGYSFGTADTTVTGFTPAVGTPIVIGVKPDGWLAGGQMGYNWQAAGSPWVFGLETDFQWTSESGTGNCSNATCVSPLPVVAAGATVKNGYPYFGTFRGRIGWDPSQWLFYVTGGLAYADTTRQVNQLGVVSYQDKAWRIGWTVGGGIEYAFNSHWSVKAEYLYIDYGTGALTIAATGPLGAAPNGPVSLSTKWTDSVARGGINYRL
jgi:outer membrane immunogenic protein